VPGNLRRRGWQHPSVLLGLSRMAIA